MKTCRNYRCIQHYSSCKYNTFMIRVSRDNNNCQCIKNKGREKSDGFEPRSMCLLMHYLNFNKRQNKTALQLLFIISIGKSLQP